MKNRKVLSKYLQEELSAVDSLDATLLGFMYGTEACTAPLSETSKTVEAVAWGGVYGIVGRDAR